MTNLMHKFFNTFITILYMYMFRAISCSSSGGQIVLIQHLVSSLSVSDRPVHRLRRNANGQLDTNFFSTFITVLYMYKFRAISCSSSGGQIVLIQHLVSSLSVSDRPVHRLRENWLEPVHLLQSSTCTCCEQYLAHPQEVKLY